MSLNLWKIRELKKNFAVYWWLRVKQRSTSCGPHLAENKRLRKLSEKVKNLLDKILFSDIVTDI